MWENSKQSNICLIGISEEEKWGNEAEQRVEKIMSNNFPNKWQKLNYRWAQKTPNRSLGFLLLFVCFFCFVRLGISYCKCQKGKEYENLLGR